MIGNLERPCGIKVINFSTRIIARLDLKESYLIKGIYFEGLKKIGNPIATSKKYYEQGVDEIICIDVVASLFERKMCFDTIAKISQNCFLPLTVGGGLNNYEDVEKCFLNGSDKVSINSAFFKEKSFIKKIVNNIGSQALQGSIQSKNIDDKFYAFYEAGRENSYVEVTDHILQLQDQGVGEIVITSVDKDGTLSGMDWKILDKIKNILTVPLIFGGGFSSTKDLERVMDYEFVSGVSIASAFHSDLVSVDSLQKTRVSHK